MGLFNIFKKSAEPNSLEKENPIYELLFCDDLNLYRNDSQLEDYPWSVLFSEKIDIEGLRKIATDDNQDSRIKLLAFNKLKNVGYKIDVKELLGVIVEIGLPNGLDVLAVYSDGNARYINYTGKIIIWESKDEVFDNMLSKLFSDSINVVNRIGPWHEPRRPRPAKGITRITFLVSNGLYFGEAPTNTLFTDPLAGPALASATEIMKFLVEK